MVFFSSIVSLKDLRNDSKKKHVLNVTIKKGKNMLETYGNFSLAFKNAEKIVLAVNLNPSKG